MRRDSRAIGTVTGDGDAEPAVYRDGAWYSEGQPPAYFGLPGDVPVPVPMAIYQRFFAPGA